jgi:hypothetical protein
MMHDHDHSNQVEHYEQAIEQLVKDRERSFTGKVVVHGKDVPWQMARQAHYKMYLWPSCYSHEQVETALDDWVVFVQNIKTHSGKHRHQGGLVIYILEGEGYTIVDGERHDWEAGDLLLLPVKPGGVEHQHFNRYNDKPAKWIAFISPALFEWGATEMVQIENHPDYKGH